VIQGNEVGIRRPAPKGAIHSGRLAAWLKRCPDTSRLFGSPRGQFDAPRALVIASRAWLFDLGRGKHRPLQILRGLLQIFQTPEIAPVVLVGTEGKNLFSLAGEPQIGRDDGKDARLSEIGKQARGNDVDPGESKGLHTPRGADDFRGGVAPDAAAAQLKVFVEEQVARRLAVLHGKGGKRLVLRVRFGHAPEFDGADDIDVVQQDRLVMTRIPGAGEEKVRGFFQASAGVEQDVFARNGKVHAEVVVGSQIVDEFVGKVVDIDDHVVNFERAQAREGDLEERPAVDFHQRLGAVVGEWPQTGAEAGGKNHRLHFFCCSGFCFSNSR